MLKEIDQAMEIRTLSASFLRRAALSRDTASAGHSF
jgi:hypothetical protein